VGIKDDVEIGAGTKIWHPELVNIFDTKIGKNCNIGAFVEISGATIGDNVTIGAFCFICSGVVIEDDVFIGPKVAFTNDKYPPTPKDEWEIIKTIVHKKASIGLGSIILPGCHIGQGAFIAAGSVVTTKIWPGAKVKGSPARMYDV